MERVAATLGVEYCAVQHAGVVLMDDLRRETRFRGPPFLHERAVVSGMSIGIGGADQSFGVFGAYTSTHQAGY